MTEHDDVADVTFERTFAAPRELVWACLTEPEHLTNYFGPPGISAPLDKITVEPRAGGQFSITMVNDETGEEYPNPSVIAEWEPPVRYLTSETGANEGITMEVVLEDLGDGRTRMLMTQRNMPAPYRSPEAEAGMNAYLDLAVEYINAQA